MCSPLSSHPVKIPSSMKRNRLTIGLFVLIAAFANPEGNSNRTLIAADKTAKVIPAEIKTILSTYCFTCHGADEQEADLRLDQLSADFINDRAAAERWHDSLNRIQRGEMPPKEGLELSTEERRTLTIWIRKNLDEAIAAGRGKSEGVVLRRLNKTEYQYAMTDLLGVEMDYSSKLPTEPLSEDGFQNNGDALKMSGLQLDFFLESARAGMSRVLVDGQRPEQIQVIDEKPGNKRNEENGETQTSLRLGRANNFTLNLKEIPSWGPFTIRIHARAEPHEGLPHPKLRVEYGNQISGAQPITEEVDNLTVSSTESTVYEYTGWAEDFPYLDLKTVPKSKQFLVVTNGLEDGKPAPKRKKKEPIPWDPEYPKVRIESVEFLAYHEEQWPPARHRKILFSDNNEESPEYVAEVLRRFMRRAWRRPVSDEEVALYQRHFNKVHQHSDSFIAAMRETLAVVLTSPNFLYLVEPVAEQNSSRELTAHELAARLALCLWCSIPDERLSELADTGKLLNEKILSSEISRMLADEKSNRFLDQFSTQWLDLEGVDRVAVNPEYYPRFNEDLKQLMVRESQLFFAEIFRNDLSALKLLDADFTMANLKLAKHYGLKGPRSQDFVRVDLTDSQRPGGLLGQAAIHLSNSNGEDSHPIKRAVWIRERLLDDPPLPPPPNVPALDATNPDFAKLSVRQQMEVHRADPACADCHRGIDPWGVALEHFDAVGQFRKTIKRPVGKAKNGKSQFQQVPVEATSELPDGRTLNSLDELQNYLLEARREQFARTVVVKMMTFALGRSLELTDEPVVDRLLERFSENNYRLSGLIHDIILSESFRTK